VEAIHYLCFRSSIDPVEKLAHLLTDPEPMIQAAACACSLNQDMGPVQQMAYERLEQLLNKQDPALLEARLEVAHILEYVRPSPSSVELCRRLLSDPAAEVRRATLHSIAETRPAGILPALIQLLSDPTVRAEVRDALASYGDTVMPQLKAFLDDRNILIDQKKLILRILADIGTPEAADVLITAAMGPNLVLRFIATKALNKIKKRRTENLPKEKLSALLDQEIAALEIELQRTQFISPDPRGVLQAVLNQRRNWAKERIFRVLGLLYDSKSIYNAYVALSGSDRRRADWALEYLDAALAPEHRYRVLGLLEFPDDRDKPTPEARKNVLFGYIGASDQLPAAAMIADLSDSELAQWKSDIYDVLSAFPSQPLVNETLDWRYLRMKQPDNIQQKLTTIQKLEYLNKVEIFSRLGPQELLMLANICAQSDYAAGEVIFKEGDPGLEIFLLVSGSVQQKRTGVSHNVLPGHPFGTLSVLSDQPRLFSATAIEPSVCLRIPKANFWEVLEDYPSVSQVIFKSLAQRIRDLTEGKDISTDTKTLA
jgi:CRP/FNR family transcriptional regulator, cyclic AMP receptor protein